VVDTSVLVAGVSAFKGPDRVSSNPSARLIRDWLDYDTFTWLITEEILNEYKAVLARLRVRRHTIGVLINHLRGEAGMVEARRTFSTSPDPGDEPFWGCAEDGRADFIVTLNPKDFPKSRLRAKVILPGEPIPTTAGQKRRN
jgi:predicted nucleic acid-binding protein